ncbi:MAG TPA: hypothetical protein VEQ34_10235 [Pyrinomonadaceae bacterium]|nr:hypothetical protein [Pyrinomonadaceae bacterium]
MKPVSLIALFIAVSLLIMGITARGQGSERVLSNALIVAASFIIGMIVMVWIIAFLKNRK